ncbi:MAG: class I SAM-dependent methyltransferase [Elainellaceae cyanobacterium]
MAPSLIYSQGMLANAYFFGHPLWAAKYLRQESNNPFWTSRWREVIPCWDDKVVVDIGCGPGNVYATLGGQPALMIGVDISLDALKMAQHIGYTPLLADAQKLPLKSGFADIVMLNGTIHHCDDMAVVLSEAARLVKPGGLLVTDLDPQVSARNYQGLGLWFDHARRHPIRELMRPSQRRSDFEVKTRVATEIHNFCPGDGITPELYHRVLDPLGFNLAIYPHNHQIGADVFQGHCGKAPWYIRMAQQLSGIKSDQTAAAQSIMCVAGLN